MFQTNKNGLSFISFLISALLIGILASMMLSYYKKTSAVSNTQKSAQAQAVDQARAAVKNLEQVSNQRANALDNF